MKYYLNDMPEDSWKRFIAHVVWDWKVYSAIGWEDHVVKPVEKFLHEEYQASWEDDELGSPYLEFESEEQAMLFKLRWS